MAALTTEDRMVLRDEIRRKIEEHFNIATSAALEDDRETARKEIARLQARWEVISAFGGVVPTEVNGRDLLNEITRALLRFIVVTKESAQILALWIVHTHVFAYEVFYHTPRLLIWSKQPEAGKSTLNDVLEQLVRNPRPSAGITGDILEAILKKHQTTPPQLLGFWAPVGGPDVEKPTFLIDEADNIMQTQKLRRILNSGHKWNGVIYDQHAEPISTFTPVVLFEIDAADRTLPSMRSYQPLKTRSIEIELQLSERDLDDDAYPVNPRFRELGLVLRPKIETWVETVIEDVRQSYERPRKDKNVPECIRPRARNNWETLIAIADVAGGDWPELARALCVRFAPHRHRSAIEDDGEATCPSPASAQARPYIGSKVTDAKSRIMIALRQHSPQSRFELRKAGCKNIAGADFAQALVDLERENQIACQKGVFSGGKPKEMWGLVAEDPSEAPEKPISGESREEHPKGPHPSFPASRPTTSDPDGKRVA